MTLKPAGYLAWVRGSRGPQPERYSADREQYLSAKAWQEKTYYTVPLDESEMKVSLDALARKYPFSMESQDK